MTPQEKATALGFAKFLVRLKVEPISQDIWEVHGLAGTLGFPVMNLEQLFELYEEEIQQL